MRPTRRSKMQIDNRQNAHPQHCTFASVPGEGGCSEGAWFPLGKKPATRQVRVANELWHLQESGTFIPARASGEFVCNTPTPHKTAHRQTRPNLCHFLLKCQTQLYTSARRETSACHSHCPITVYKMVRTWPLLSDVLISLDVSLMWKCCSHVLCPFTYCLFHPRKETVAMPARCSL